MAILNEAVKFLSNSSWWIKSDGVDVVSGLMESTRQEWYGDVDLADGVPQKSHQEYLNRLALVDGLSRIISDPHQRLLTCSDLRVVQTSLKDDGEFLDKSLS